MLGCNNTKTSLTSQSKHGDFSHVACAVDMERLWPKSGTSEKNTALFKSKFTTFPIGVHHEIHTAGRLFCILHNFHDKNV